MGTVSPYTLLAGSYAEVMADIPYAAWFSFAEKYLPSPDRSAKTRIAELFCGPAKLAAIAARAGYTSVALDNYVPFLKKIPVSAVGAKADELPFADRSLAGVLSVNCSVHYLPDIDTLSRYFRECRRVLETGGVCVFDVCPPERARQLHGQTLHALNGEISFAHRYPSASQQLETTVLLRTSGNEISQEIHLQRIFSEDEIKTSFTAAGFALKARAANYGIPGIGDNSPIITWVLE